MTKEQETWKRGYEAGHQDGYDAGYVAAKREIGFDAARGAVIHAAEMAAEDMPDIVNCTNTKCDNCVNHNYCDYEPYKAERRTDDKTNKSSSC